MVFDFTKFVYDIFFSIWLLKFIDNNKKILRNELLKID